MDAAFNFNGLRGHIVKAGLRKFVNGIKAASNNSRSVQGLINQRVSKLQMEKLDAADGSVSQVNEKDSQ